MHRPLYLFCLLLILSTKTLLAQSDLELHAIVSTENKITSKAHINLLKKAKVKTKTDRRYHYFTKGKIRITQGGYTGHLLQGNFEKNNAQGQLLEKGQYKNGLKDGTWKRWNIQGQLILINKWKKGKQKGKFQEFDEQGELIRTGQYKDGQLHGKIIHYEGGEVLQKYRYKKGELKN
jgi:Uncharacterized protein conserved in bacteria